MEKKAMSNSKDEYLLPVNVLQMIEQYRDAKTGSPVELNLEARLMAIKNRIEAETQKKIGLRNRK
jgi:hypothetical protein